MTFRTLATKRICYRRFGVWPALGLLLSFQVWAESELPILNHKAPQALSEAHDQNLVHVSVGNYQPLKRAGLLIVKLGVKSKASPCLDRVRIFHDEKPFVEARFGRCQAEPLGTPYTGLALERPYLSETVKIEASFLDDKTLSKRYKVQNLSGFADQNYNAYHNVHHTVLLRGSVSREGDAGYNYPYVEVQPEPNNVLLNVDGIGEAALIMTAACSSSTSNGVQQIRIISKRKDGSSEEWFSIRYFQAPLNAQFTIYLATEKLRLQSKDFGGDKRTINMECTRGDGEVVRSTPQQFELPPPVKWYYDPV